MNIIIVEDDHLQAEWLESNLRSAFRGSDVLRISTEAEFYDWFDSLREESIAPDVFVIDVMLRWTDPSPEMRKAPEEVVKNGFYRAGLRCQRRILSDPRTLSTPIILYTVLEELDLANELIGQPSNVTYLRKDSAPEPLIKLIRETLRIHSSA